MKLLVQPPQQRTQSCWPPNRVSAGSFVGTCDGCACLQAGQQQVGGRRGKARQQPGSVPPQAVAEVAVATGGPDDLQSYQPPAILMHEVSSETLSARQLGSRNSLNAKRGQRSRVCPHLALHALGPRRAFLALALSSSTKLARPAWHAIEGSTHWSGSVCCGVP